jgi:subtilisin family serine protease
MRFWGDINKRRFFKKRFALWLLPGLFVFLCGPLVSLASADSVSQTLVVRLAAGVPADALSAQPFVSHLEPVFAQSPNVELGRTYRLEYQGPQAALENLKRSSIFDYAVSDAPLKAASVYTSDPQFTLDPNDATKEWWLVKTRVLEAWDASRGSHDVTVAVVDTGVNGFHEDLNDGRVGVGYANYCQVMNTATGKCTVHAQSPIAAGVNSDDNGHGTIVAGIIGAVPNNMKGIAGVNWQVRLMPVKALDSTGQGVSSDVAGGIVWAADNGAAIINLSLGGASLEGNPILNDAITYAYNKGVLVVAAAGNDSSLVGADMDIEPVYPICNDGGKNMVLGVAASDINDRKASFSNFGRACIDVVAPGTAYFNSKADQKGILSTYYDPTQPGKNNLYAYASGTSMAAPIVSGIAALLKSIHPDLTGPVLRDRLIASADNIDAVNQDACKGLSCTGRLGSGRINAQKALQTTTFTSATLIKSGNSPVYYIENGLRRAVSNFVLSQRGFDLSAVKLVATGELELLPVGQPLPPLDGTLVKSSFNPTVYYVAGDVLQPVSYFAFVSNNFSWSNLVDRKSVV